MKRAYDDAITVLTTTIKKQGFICIRKTCHFPKIGQNYSNFLNIKFAIS